MRFGFEVTMYVMNK
ncbi:MAG: coenzyme PQQ precursor peptide PqqA [Methylophilaceae bacterium 17-44-8]|nr:MAG: coenzyme PQQ precursor peptide PqqA [Methylophilaceae bacterium 17-44-8]